MWAAIVAFVGKLIDLAVGIFTAKDERDVSHDQGQTQGRAEQKAADQGAVISGDAAVIATQGRIQKATIDDANMSDETALQRLKDGTA